MGRGKNRRKSLNKLESAASDGPSARQVRALRELQGYITNGYSGDSADIARIARQLGYTVSKNNKHKVIYADNGEIVTTMPSKNRGQIGRGAFKGKAKDLYHDFEERVDFSLTAQY